MEERFRFERGPKSNSGLVRAYGIKIPQNESLLRRARNRIGIEIEKPFGLGTTLGHTALFIGVDWASAKVYPGNLAASDPALAGTTYYEVQVLDVNKSADSFDTRRLFNNGIEEETGGAGIGVMGILVDANFEIVAHTWSIPTSDYVTHTDSWLNSLHGRLKLQNEREMVIGRIPAMP